MNKRERLSKIPLIDKKWEIGKIVMIFFVLISVLVTAWGGAYANEREMKKQLQQNLADVATQNAMVLYSKIQTNYELLQSLARELEGVTEEDIKEKLSHFEVFLEELHLKRFAYCFFDGTTYATDGASGIDLSYREFYQSGMQGSGSITGILSDALQSEHSQVNVMTIPIYGEEDTPSAVFGVAYDTEKFNENLLIDSFDGQGFNCVVNEAGAIMAVKENEHLNMGESLIDKLLAVDEQNAECAELLQEKMQTMEPCGGTLYLEGQHYYSAVPVTLMGGSVTWYVITLVPAEILQERLLPIQTNQYKTSIGIGVLIAVAATVLFAYYKAQHKKIISYAYEDSLTKSANFVKFCIDMEQRKYNGGFLVTMDIANFNNIAIVAGEAASDKMILQTWEIIHSSLCGAELAGRIKDDVFLMFLYASDRESLLERLERISMQITEKAKEFSVYGIQAGYGIHRISEEETIETAYSKAKLAREYATTKPEQNYAFYSEVDRQQTQIEKQLEEQFPDALANREFKVWYQPKYSVEDGTIVGSEALVRWQKEDGEMISPGKFIPLFERNGMILKLDEYMFRAVCEQQKSWMEQGRKIYPVSINISRTSLYRMDLEKSYGAILQEFGIRPEYIQLEVTETAIEQMKDICEILNRFRRMGIKILMDDFGTGYSSLATLSAQCFDVLKIDKSLIDQIGNKDGETLLYHVIQMGQQLGLYITAEGVEQESQVSFLKQLYCDDIQGYYFSKPLPVAEFEKKLQ